MFYFLDALDEPPLCRFCLVSEELRLPRETARRVPVAPPAAPTPVPPWVEDVVPEIETIPATPFYDAFTEIDAALREVAPGHPLAVTARRLQTEAARRWKVGRISEAVYIIQRLRATLVDLGLAAPFPTLTTPGPGAEPEPLISAPPEQLVQILLAACSDEYDRPASRLRTVAAPGRA